MATLIDSRLGPVSVHRCERSPFLLRISRFEESLQIQVGSTVFSNGEVFPIEVCLAYGPLVVERSSIIETWKIYLLLALVSGLSLPVS